MIGSFVELELVRYIAVAAAVLVVMLLLYRQWRRDSRARQATPLAPPRPTQTKNQVAAIPVRTAAGGTIEVLVISTRGSGRWTVPKGWPMPGRSDAEAAAQEAYEEAGVRGIILSEPIGTFEYVKRRNDSETLHVTVYRLDVRQNARRWRERGQRKQRWLEASAAADCVAWSGLAEIIRSLETTPSV